MIRKTAKQIKKKKETKPSPKSKYPNPLSYYHHNPNITHSEHCVIKSWRLPPKQCPTASSRHPTLVEINGKYKRCWRFYLPYKCEAFSPYQIGYYVSMVVTGYCSPAFAFSIREHYTSHWRWTREDCDIKEPYDPSQKMRFCQVVGLNWTFYAMSLQGSVVVIDKDEADSARFGITRIGGNRAVPSKACRQYREYLVESHEQIFVVFLMSRKSIHVVDDVEVFQLDTQNLLWVQVENIGESTFFLEDQDCVRFDASENMMLKKNCIYFTHKWIDVWMVYDMETRLILPHSDVMIGTQ